MRINKILFHEKQEMSQLLEEDKKNKANSHSISVLSNLAEACEKTGQLEQAIIYNNKVIQLQSANTKARANLARIRLKLGDVEAAIVICLKALAFSKEDAEVYQEWGNALGKNGQLIEAIMAYKTAIKLKPLNLSFYVKLTNLYLKQLLNISFKVGETLKKIPILRKKQDNFIYLRMWNILNQPDLENKNEENSKDLKLLDNDLVEYFFAHSSQYKIIYLDSISQKDEELIESLGMSINYLQSNATGLITREGCVLEKLSPEQLSKEINVPFQVAKTIQINRFQDLSIEQGCIYAVCPSTGKAIASSQSVVLPQIDLSYVFYRFVGHEVFYLITGFCWLGFPKLYLYFPRQELIVILNKDHNIVSQKLLNSINNLIDHFKAYCVTNFYQIRSYLINPQKKKLVFIIGIQHFAHHIWNELSAIYRLKENHLLDNFDRILVIAEPLGSITDIFPEISPTKIQKINNFNEVSMLLDSNSFVVRVGYNYIQEDLVNRVYKTSLNYCHSSLIAEIEEAKSKHFPLLWITLRLDARTWISQKEGIINIVKMLSQDFPNLGVVFDGFSVAKGVLSWGHEHIKNETKLVQDICQSLSPEIGVYDTVGSMLYESIIWANAIDLYLSHHGSIQHKVGWLANKPGVVHGNREILKGPINMRAGSWERENGIIPIWVSQEYIEDISDAINVNSQENDFRHDLGNYNCDWRYIYDELLQLALASKQNSFK